MEQKPETEMVVRPQGTMGAVSASREVAEVRGAILVAQQMPRDIIVSRARILNACQRIGLAEKAVYSYPRGGTQVTGPSIRLAEMLAQEWGNIAYGVRELEQRHGESTVEAFAWDMERNVRQSKTFQVKHQRKARGEVHTLEDPRDIYEMTANQGARRVRACLLGIIPGDIVEEAVAECEKTLTTNVKITPETIKRMLEAFAEFKVTKEQIEKKLQRKLDSILPAQMVHMKSIINSMKDGMSGPADWFEVEAPADEGEAKGTEALKEKLKGGDK